MTITQTVDIPVDRRLHFDLEIPREIPTGKAQVKFQVIPFVKKEEKAEKSPEKTIPKGKIGMTRKELDEFLKNAHTPISDSLVGIIPNPENKTHDELRMEGMMEKYGEYFK